MHTNFTPPPSPPSSIPSIRIGLDSDFSTWPPPHQFSPLYPFFPKLTSWSSTNPPPYIWIWPRHAHIKSRGRACCSYPHGSYPITGTLQKPQIYLIASTRYGDYSTTSPSDSLTTFSCTTIWTTASPTLPVRLSAPTSSATPCQALPKFLWQDLWSRPCYFPLTLTLTLTW